MTIMPKPARPLSVPEAGKKYFGLGKNGSYEAAKRGTIPIIKVGPRTYRVPVRLLEQMLDNPPAA